MKLQQRHLKCIQLMTSTDMTIQAIADELGVNNNSITLWLKDDDFSTALDKEIRRKFARLSARALNKLEQLLDAKNESVAFASAKEILNKGGYKEVDKVETTETVINVTVDDVDG